MNFRTPPESCVNVRLTARRQWELLTPGLPKLNQFWGQLGAVLGSFFADFLFLTVSVYTKGLLRYELRLA